MPIFRVSGRVVGSKYIGEFEAETFEQAIEKASKSDGAYVSFCHQCSGECQDPEVDEESLVAEIDEKAATPAELREHQEFAVRRAIERGVQPHEVGLGEREADMARKRLVRKGLIRWDARAKAWKVVRP